MGKCVLCPYNSDPNKRKCASRPMHCFPDPKKCPELHNKWLAVVLSRNPKFKWSQHSRICSIHFPNGSKRKSKGGTLIDRTEVLVPVLELQPILTDSQTALLQNHTTTLNGIPTSCEKQDTLSKNTAKKRKRVLMTDVNGEEVVLHDASTSKDCPKVPCHSIKGSSSAASIVETKSVTPGRGSVTPFSVENVAQVPSKSAPLEVRRAIQTLQIHLAKFENRGDSTNLNAEDFQAVTEINDISSKLIFAHCNKFKKQSICQRDEATDEFMQQYNTNDRNVVSHEWLNSCKAVTTSVAVLYTQNQTVAKTNDIDEDEQKMLPTGILSSLSPTDAGDTSAKPPFGSFTPAKDDFSDTGTSYDSFESNPNRRLSTDSEHLLPSFEETFDTFFTNKFDLNHIDPVNVECCDEFLNNFIDKFQQ